MQYKRDGIHAYRCRIIAQAEIVSRSDDDSGSYKLQRHADRNEGIFPHVSDPYHCVYHFGRDDQREEVECRDTNHAAVEARDKNVSAQEYPAQKRENHRYYCNPGVDRKMLRQRQPGQYHAEACNSAVYYSVGNSHHDVGEVQNGQSEAYQRVPFNCLLFSVIHQSLLYVSADVSVHPHVPSKFILFHDISAKLSELHVADVLHVVQAVGPKSTPQ